MRLSCWVIVAGLAFCAPRPAEAHVLPGAQFWALSSQVAVNGEGSGVSGGHTLTIMDDFYGIPAGTVAVPSGWRSIGTVMRVSGCHGNPFLSIEFTVSDRDGLYAVADLPGATWSFSDGAQMQQIMVRNRCPGIAIKDAASFLADISVPSIHPGADIIKVSSGGPLVQQAIATIRSGAQNVNQHPRVTGAAVRIRYNRGGALVDEELSAIVSCSDLHSMAMFGSPAYTTTTCNTYGVSVSRAPAGKLDTFLAGPVFGKVVKSVKTDNVWLHRMVSDQNARFQAADREFNRVAAQSLANLKAEGDAREARAKAFDSALRRSTQKSMDQAAASQNAIDHQAHQVVNFASDRADYINPATGQKLNLDYNANHSWGSTDGSTVVLSGDSTLDPNGVVDPVHSSYVELVPSP
jgi:hypothetical protein